LSLTSALTAGRKDPGINQSKRKGQALRVIVIVRALVTTRAPPAWGHDAEESRKEQWER
jgi:hypothetical protein